MIFLVNLFFFYIFVTEKEITVMKIIHAKTCKQPGCCEVTYGDGTTDVVTKSIGELYSELNSTGDPIYYMVGRSDFVCLDNIVKIHPVGRELTLAFDSLNLKHLQLNYTPKLLRDLRGKILM